MVIFLYKLCIFVLIQHGCLANVMLASDPSNTCDVIEWLCCIFFEKKNEFLNVEQMYIILFRYLVKVIILII